MFKRGPPQDAAAATTARARLAREASDRLDAEDPEGAFDLALRGLALTRRARDEAAASEFELLAGMAQSQMGELEAALARFDRLLARDPDDVDAHLERGWALYELCRFPEARAAIEAAARLDPPGPSNAWPIYALGLIAERMRQPTEAARCFAEARRLDPEQFPPPIALSPEEFDRAVEAALERLPEQVRDYLSNVAITVEELPADDDLFSSTPPLSPSILGLFRGAPYGEKASMDPWSHFPSSIVLYQRNLERFAGDRRTLIDEIGITLLHEVGHFLGLDEEELRARGLD